MSVTAQSIRTPASAGADRPGITSREAAGKCTSNVLAKAAKWVVGSRFRHTLIGPNRGVRRDPLRGMLRPMCAQGVLLVCCREVDLVRVTSAACCSAA